MRTLLILGTAWTITGALTATWLWLAATRELDDYDNEFLRRTLIDPHRLAQR